MSGLPKSMRFCDADLQLSLDPHDDGFVQSPYRVYAYLHERTTRFFWREYGMWCFCGHAIVNRLFRDKRLGRYIPEERKAQHDRGHLGNFDAVERHSLLELEPPDHTRLRALVNRAFVSRNIEALAPEIEGLAHQLIDRFESDGAGDLLPAFATPVPVAIIAGLLGVPADTAPQLLAWSHAMVAMYTHGRTRETENAADRAAREFSNFIRDEISNSMAAAKDGTLLGLLRQARREGKMSDGELVSSAILLLNAGHEATVHQTGNAIRTILNLGTDPRALFSSRERSQAVAEELIRIDPPLHMFTRHAYADVEIEGDFGIEEGAEIGLMLGAANHDPSVFERPDIFDPDRPKKQNMSFGAGIHFCIGAPLARLELQVALKVLFERLPGLALNGATRYADTFHFHGLERLDCKWG